MNDGQVLTDRLLKVSLAFAWLAAYLENHGVDVAQSLWLAWIKDTDSVVAVLGFSLVLFHWWQASRLGRLASKAVDHALDGVERRLEEA